MRSNWRGDIFRNINYVIKTQLHKIVFTCIFWHFITGPMIPSMSYGFESLQLNSLDIILLLFLNKL